MHIGFDIRSVLLTEQTPFRIQIFDTFSSPLPLRALQCTPACSFRVLHCLAIRRRRSKSWAGEMVLSTIVDQFLVDKLGLRWHAVSENENLPALNSRP